MASKSSAQLNREIAEALSRTRFSRGQGSHRARRFPAATETTSHAQKAAMTPEQFNALAVHASDTLRQEDFDNLLAAVRKLQPKTIIGVHGTYGGKEGIAEGRFIQLLETSPISAPWSRQVVVEEIVPTYRQGAAPRQLEVSPYALRALQKTKFSSRRGTRHAVQNQ